jgi:hypothetical protein
MIQPILIVIVIQAILKLSHFIQFVSLAITNAKRVKIVKGNVNNVRIPIEFWQNNVDAKKIFILI